MQVYLLPLGNIFYFPGSSLQFETAPDLLSGIELTTNGLKVAWSIADYLASLERGVGELLKEKPKVKAEPKPEAMLEEKNN